MPGETGRLGRELDPATITDEGGAPGRTRTCDPLLRRQMLYPLSYGSAIARDGNMRKEPPPIQLGKIKGCRNGLRQPDFQYKLL